MKKNKNMTDKEKELSYWSNIFMDWTGISFCFSETEKILNYFRSHKEEIIKIIKEM